MSEKLKELFKSAKIYIKETVKRDKNGNIITEKHIFIGKKKPKGKGWIPIKYAKDYDFIIDAIERLKFELADLKELQKTLKLTEKYKFYSEDYKAMLRERIRNVKLRIKQIENELKQYGITNVREIL